MSSLLNTANCPVFQLSQNYATLIDEDWLPKTKLLDVFYSSTKNLLYHSQTTSSNSRGGSDVWWQSKEKQQTLNLVLTNLMNDLRSSVIKSVTLVLVLLCDLFTPPNCPISSTSNNNNSTNTNNNNGNSHPLNNLINKLLPSFLALSAQTVKVMQGYCLRTLERMVLQDYGDSDDNSGSGNGSGSGEDDFDGSNSNGSDGDNRANLKPIYKTCPLQTNSLPFILSWASTAKQKSARHIGVTLLKLLVHTWMPNSPNSNNNSSSEGGSNSNGNSTYDPLSNHAQSIFKTLTTLIVDSAQAVRITSREISVLMCIRYRAFGKGWVGGLDGRERTLIVNDIVKRGGGDAWRDLSESNGKIATSSNSSSNNSNARLTKSGPIATTATTATLSPSKQPKRAITTDDIRRNPSASTLSSNSASSSSSASISSASATTASSSTNTSMASTSTSAATNASNSTASTMKSVPSNPFVTVLTSPVGVKQAARVYPKPKTKQLPLPPSTSTSTSTGMAPLTKQSSNTSMKAEYHETLHETDAINLISITSATQIQAALRGVKHRMSMSMGMGVGGGSGGGGGVGGGGSESGSGSGYDEGQDKVGRIVREEMKNKRKSRIGGDWHGSLYLENTGGLTNSNVHVYTNGNADNNANTNAGKSPDLHQLAKPTLRNQNEYENENVNQIQVQPQPQPPKRPPNQTKNKTRKQILEAHKSYISDMMDTLKIEMELLDHSNTSTSSSSSSSSSFPSPSKSDSNSNSYTNGNGHNRDGGVGDGSGSGEGEDEEYIEGIMAVLEMREALGLKLKKIIS